MERELPAQFGSKLVLLIYCGLSSDHVMFASSLQRDLEERFPGRTDKSCFAGTCTDPKIHNRVRELMLVWKSIKSLAVMCIKE